MLTGWESRGIQGVSARISQIQLQLAALTGPSPTPRAAAPSSAVAEHPFAVALRQAAAVQAVPAATAPKPLEPPGLPAPSAGAGAPLMPLVSSVSSPGTQSSAELAARDQWALPVIGKVTSEFGMRKHPITGVYKLHTGLDLAAPAGSPIRASAAGRVRSAGWDGANGWTVVIDHGQGLSTLYAHASRLRVKPHEIVSAGQRIADVGASGWATGPHLHFEVRRQDRPLDPGDFLKQSRH